MKEFLCTDGSARKWQQWFFRHLPRREESQVKALVQTEGSAGFGGWWVAPLASQIFGVSPAQGELIAEEPLHSWIHLNRAEAAHQSPEPNPSEGDFHHLRQSLVPVELSVSSCSLQESAVSRWELPPTAPNACVQRGGRQAERGALCFCWGGCAPLMELGGFLTLSPSLFHSSTWATGLWSFLTRVGEALSSWLACA